MVSDEYHVTERSQTGNAAGMGAILRQSKVVINSPQGESLASIVESFVRASHVNVTKGLATPTGAYMLLHASMYARIGMLFLMSELLINGLTRNPRSYPSLLA